jgi:hypothetical protein
MLLQAFDEEDPQAARQALSSPFIKHMDVEYARLARDLPLPEGVVPVSKPSVRQNAAPSYVSPKAISAATSAEVSDHIFKVLILFIIMVFDILTFAQSIVHSIVIQ